MKLQTLKGDVRDVPWAEEKIDVVSTDDELLRGSERRGITRRARSHHSDAFSDATWMRENCGAKSAERDCTVEIVLEGIGHALAGKWPMPNQDEQTDPQQNQHHNCSQLDPSSMANLKPPASWEFRPFDDGSVTL